MSIVDQIFGLDDDSLRERAKEHVESIYTNQGQKSMLISTALLQLLIKNNIIKEDDFMIEYKEIMKESLKQTKLVVQNKINELKNAKTDDISKYSIQYDIKLNEFVLNELNEKLKNI